MLKTSQLFLAILFIAASFASHAQSPKLNVIAYYSGDAEQIDKFAVEKLTHIIFSFCHLNGNQLTVDNSKDSVTIAKLVSLKQRNPSMKVILSLGGWGGCKTCSDVFSTAEGRKEFAKSVLKLNQAYKTDGIDLDWEYPTIEGYPEHPYKPEDKNNFTELVRELRRTLGKKYEISFAAGGFQKFLEESVDWKAVMKEVDRVNLMTYDLVNGYSTVTGHHTPLYSNDQQKESTDNAVQYLIKIGVPRNKLVIGAAFYGRMWENVEDVSHGLYQSGKFKSFVDYSRLTDLLKDNNYEKFWDVKANAPYLYNATEKLYITYDSEISMKLKTQYAIDQKLDGIMFWELATDRPVKGLLDAIDFVKKATRGN